MNLFLPLLLCIGFAVQAQGLSREEKLIVEQVNRNVPKALQLLEELVNINSGTHNIEGVKKIRSPFEK